MSDHTPLGAATAVASSWRDRLDLVELTRAQLADLDGSLAVDVVALGKAAPEMADAASSVLGNVRRRFVASEAPVPVAPGDVSVVGEHPVPGRGSAHAGRRLLDFLAAPGDAELTLFCVSGGASSLCVAPAPPLELSDLAVLWRSALAQGWDITRLNRARAATSLLGGGAILRRVRTPRSRSLVMVDNVTGGAAWVASGLTYDFRPSAQERDEIRRGVGPLAADVMRRLGAGLAGRDGVMASHVTTEHQNQVLVEPGAALGAVLDTARARGLAAQSLGAVDGDVDDVVARFALALGDAPARGCCVVAGGEVTIRVVGDGRGGRCQEFALRMGEVLAGLGRPGACVALATDGRDFVEGVAGAWSDETTLARLSARGFDFAQVLERHDAHSALASLDQLVAGGRTGWNLCDLYVVVLAPDGGSGV